MRLLREAIPPLVALTALVACGEHSHEQIPVDVPVFASGAGLRATAPSDLGWTVTVTRARVHVRDLELTILGETHTASLLRGLGAFVIGTAHAHPGHYAGGEVTGELPGDLVFDIAPDATPAPLGTASALPGVYRGANLSFGRGIDGHTAVLEGVATRDGVTVTFTANVDAATGAQVVGLPFDAEIGAAGGTGAALNLLVTDPQLGGNLFDAQDFAVLDAADGATDGLAVLEPGSPGGNRLARQFVRHDFWYMTPIVETNR